MIKTEILIIIYYYNINNQLKLQMAMDLLMKLNLLEQKTKVECVLIIEDFFKYSILYDESPHCRK